MDRYLLAPVDAVCPACHGREALELYSVGAGEAAQHYVLREVAPERHDALRRHIEALWGRPRARVVRCQTCRFGFADPYVAGDDTFYTLAYERSGYPEAKWEFDVTLEALRALVPTSGPAPRLLEVGAGDGAFVRRVSPALLPREAVLCTEYSAYGRERIEAAGIECRSADVRDAALDDQRGRVSFLCLFQVLEHLDRLDALFGRFTELAADGARLFVAVPNDRAIEFGELSGSVLDMPPNHVGRWTRAAFETIGQRHGWRLVDHRVEPDRASEKAGQHVLYRYMKSRQRAGSVANRAERVPAGPWKKPLRAAVAGAYTLATLPTLARALRTGGLGSSQWVHYEKEPA